MLMKTELLMNEINSTQKAFCGSKQGNFNDMNNTILEFVLQQMKWMMAMEVATHVKTLSGEDKASIILAVWSDLH